MASSTLAGMSPVRAAAYQFNDRFKLDLQYKGLWVDHETGTRGRPGYFKYDTATHGPILGLIINF